MQKQIDLASSYCSIRIDRTTWMVRIVLAYQSSTRLIPVFLRFRRVCQTDQTGFVCYVETK
jgi:hypothetical protein